MGLDTFTIQIAIQIQIFLHIVDKLYNEICNMFWVSFVLFFGPQNCE